MADFNPTYAVWKNIVVTPHDGNSEEDITKLCTKLDFTQSISSSAWTGSMRILDSTGLLENKGFKIRGEEKLTFEVETYDGKMEDPLKVTAQILSITEVTPLQNLTGVTFTINFISKISYTAGLRRVREAFVDLPASTIAERIFKKYFANNRLVEDTSAPNEIIPFNAKKFRTTDLGSKQRKPFYVQPTEGVMQCVIPNLPPSDAMNFLSQRSFSQSSPSCSFRFFETLTGFWFVTDEFMIQHGLQNNQTVEEFSYNAQNSQDGQDAELQVQTFKNFSNPSRVNSAKDLHNGGYRNKVIEVDLGRRRARNIDYDYIEDANYIDMSGQKTSLKNVAHTEDYIRDTFTDENAKRMIVFKDWYDENGQTLRSNQHYPEILQNRSVYTHHLGQTMVSVSLNASRLDLRPGKIISVRVPKFTIAQTPDSPYSDEFSGNYLIVSISHSLQDDVMTTNATLAKYGWSGEYRP
jgi:hypothetical protein